MRNDEHEEAYIWLRQSARFGLGDQERTVEIAIPVRPGASPQEIERLLQEADAGMDRLSLHLDQRIAALTGISRVPAESDGTAEQVPAASAPQPPMGQEASPTAQRSAPPVEAISPSIPPTGVEPFELERPAAAPTAGDRRENAPGAAPAPSERSLAEPPAQPASTRPAAPSVPARPEPATPASTGSGAPTRPAPAAPRTTPAAPPTPGAAPARAPERGPDLTRAEFLAQAAGMGLNPKQVMERLGVRTLEGLNLREALELLRRQLVRDAGAQEDETDPPAEPTARREARPQAATRNATTAASASAASSEPTPEAAAPAGAYFDEEDDLEVSFALPDDEPDEADGEYPGYMPGAEAGGAPGLEADEPEELALDDVPDLDAPDLDTAPPARAPASRRRASAASTRAAERTQAPAARQQATAPEQPSSETGAQIGPAQRTRAREVLEKLRGEAPGGAPGRDQLTAYRNIVVRELGAQQATALVQGIWRAQPERLGTDQMYALISWGKTDGFAEEARTLLALLRSQRAASDAGQADDGQASALPGRQASARAPGRGSGSAR